MRSVEEAEHHQQDALSELCQLEVSLESTREGYALDERALDLPLMEVTDEEIDAQAAMFVLQCHWERMRKLDEEIVALSLP